MTQLNSSSADSFAGKTYLITGASSGMGAATARLLGQAGANVVLTARREQLCDDVAQDVTRAGGRALVLRADVTQERDMEQAVKASVEHFGRLDGAFNNAGLLGLAQPLHEMSAEAFDAVLRTNVHGVFFAMKHQIAAMLQSGGGAIVNNASIVAHIGFPGLAHYNASKHAVLGLTKTAGLEYFKAGVRVNAVCPGPIETPMSLAGFGSVDGLNAMMAQTPAGRPGQPDEVARPVMFLLSSAAGYISGQGLIIDGGYTVQ